MWGLYIWVPKFRPAGSCSGCSAFWSPRPLCSRLWASLLDIISRLHNLGPPGSMCQAWYCLPPAAVGFELVLCDIHSSISPARDKGHVKMLIQLSVSTHLSSQHFRGLSHGYLVRFCFKTLSTNWLNFHYHAFFLRRPKWGSDQLLHVLIASSTWIRVSKVMMARKFSQGFSVT